MKRAGEFLKRHNMLFTDELDTKIPSWLKENIRLCSTDDMLTMVTSTVASTPAAPSLALLRLLGLPVGAPAGAVRAALKKKDHDGYLPIHLALHDTATGPELVRAMLEAGGDAMLAVPGWNKILPLHLAACDSPFPAVVALLLARGPAARPGRRGRRAEPGSPRSTTPERTTRARPRRRSRRCSGPRWGEACRTRE